MKRPIRLVVLVLAVITAAILYHIDLQKTPGNAPSAAVLTSPTNPPTTTGNPVPPPAAPTPAPETASTPSSPAAPTNLPSPAPAAVAAAPEQPAPPGVPPEILVQNVRRAIRQFGAEFGGNPVGTNPEITAQLAGKNPRGINFINADAGMRVNDKGEMVDAWGTPLFFHQISGADTQVRSAGPDKVMWTSDDLVAP